MRDLADLCQTKTRHRVTQGGSAQALFFIADILPLLLSDFVGIIVVDKCCCYGVTR